MVAPKREKMACQRSMTQKKEERKEREGGSHVSKKGDDTRERANALRSNPYHHPSTQLHLLIEIA